mmetsp:Transcript_15832/g.32435  ORF Transcript_15832/g.32435 Transcript_15832/m.32435 type:complete len:125 (+) Transcript_15832:1478-1852(+)
MMSREKEDSIGSSPRCGLQVAAALPIDTTTPRRAIGFPYEYLLFTPFRLGLVRGKLFTGSVPCSAAESRATTAARCRARLEKELFCLAFKRALPDVIQFDMVVATGTSSRLGWTIPFAIQASWG